MSEIRATTISDSAGTGPITLTGQSAAKAWVNFDGTGTIASRDSFNVSGLTDHAGGQYSVTVVSSFDNANYSVCANCSTEAGTNTGKIAMIFTSHTGADPVAPTASNFRISSVRTGLTDAAEVDNPYNTASAFGDLA